MLIDTHAHLNFNAYKNDLDKVIKRTLSENVWFINVGSQYETSKRAVEIAENHKEGVYAAIGLHPIHSTPDFIKKRIEPEEGGFLASGEEFDKEKYRQLAQSEKVVAIGEIGLDYYYKPKTKVKLEQFKQKQKEIFLQQLELTKELNLPVIFHCRMAHDELIKILELQVTSYKLRGVIHCFTGTLEEAMQYIKMGFYIGFNGIIFKKIERINFEEIIKKTPLDRILIETDCPYLTPPNISENQRLNQRKSAGARNEPLYVKYIAEKIAEIKNLAYEKVAEITTENAKKLFKI